jgi:equilibrative nucleoside transporter 1/2/3
MESLRALFAGPKTAQEYEPIGEDDDVPRPVTGHRGSASQRPFSLLEYSVFLLLGVAMLWAW